VQVGATMAIFGVFIYLSSTTFSIPCFFLFLSSLSFFSFFPTLFIPHRQQLAPSLTTTCSWSVCAGGRDGGYFRRLPLLCYWRDSQAHFKITSQATTSCIFLTATRTRFFCDNPIFKQLFVHDSSVQVDATVAVFGVFLYSVIDEILKPSLRSLHTGNN